MAHLGEVRADGWPPRLSAAHTAVTSGRRSCSSAFPAAETSGTSRRRGFAVRRGDTFPGLGPDWLRIAMRDPATSGAFARSLREVLT